MEAMIVHSGNASFAQSDWQNLHDALDCEEQAFMVGDADVVGGEAALKAEQALKAAVLNTPERTNAYVQADGAGGTTISASTPYSEKASRCAVDPAMLPD